MYIKEDKQRKKRLVTNHVIRSGTDIRALTILSAESGRRHTTFPFLFVRGGSTSQFNMTVSTMTVSSRKISTSQDGVGLPSTMRGSETEWRSSMVAVCWSDYVLWWQCEVVVSRRRKFVAVRGSVRGAKYRLTVAAVNLLLIYFSCKLLLNARKRV